MRGLVLSSGTGTLRDDLPEPLPGPDETLVQVLVAGVCATDLALQAGYMGFEGVPGHEFVGRALDGPLAGQRVVGEINAGCGTCERCQGGDPRHCATRSVLGILGRPGAFAERLALPTRNLVPVPDAVPDDAAVFSEPLAAALQIPAELGPFDGVEALVAGDGRLGLLCAHALHEAGARVTVAGRHLHRQELLPQGATLRTGLLEDGAAPPSGEPPYALAVEATGQADVLPRLFPWVAPKGTIVLKTTTERAMPIDLAPLVIHEQRLVGSRCGRFAPALELLATGRLPVERFIDVRLPLEHAEAAILRAGSRGVLKVLIDVDA